ncbi:uncharacterized protein O3Q21_005739 [Podargus strigoides]
MRITGWTTCSVEHCGSTPPLHPCQPDAWHEDHGADNVLPGNGRTLRGNRGDWDDKGPSAPWSGCWSGLVCAGVRGGFALPDWDLGPQHGLELGIPSPAPRLSRRNIAGSLVVVEEASDTDAPTEEATQTQALG